MVGFLHGLQVHNAAVADDAKNARDRNFAGNRTLPYIKSFRCADAIVSARILREDSQEALSSSIAILRRPLQGLRTDCLLWTVTLVCRQVGFAKR